MSEKLKYPQWQKPLQDVIVEFNPRELPVRVHEAEAIIFERFRILSSCLRSHNEERQALADALATLRVLKRNDSASGKAAAE